MWKLVSDAQPIEDFLTCPSCAGRIHGVALACGPQGSRMMQTTCDFCHGTGMVSVYLNSIWRMSTRLRNLRVARNMTVREASTAYSAHKRAVVTMSQWSALEHGRTNNLIEIEDAKTWLENLR